MLFLFVILLLVWVLNAILVFACFLLAILVLVWFLFVSAGPVAVAGPGPPAGSFMAVMIRPTTAVCSVCSMQCAVCSVQCVVCAGCAVSAVCEVCSVQCAV